MDMSFTFWLLTVVMVVIAMSLLIFPVISRHRQSIKTVWLLAIVVPVVAIALYAVLGQPEATRNTTDQQHRKGGARPASAASSSSTENIASVASLVSGLEERLKADPADAKGWLLLAKTYSHLDRPEDAAMAYEKAANLGMTDQDLEAKLDNSNAAAAVSPIIRGRLTIADSARGRLDPGDSVFIFAKSTDGSALPIAVLRKVAGDLPFDFELSDKQAMSAAANLSNTAVVTITARISKSGNAMQAEPGLEVVSAPISVGDDILVELHLGPAQIPDES